MLETAMAVENGADEIDVVISIGEFLNGEYDLMGNEIETLRKEIGDEITLKVILESGILAEPELIHRAAVIAMLAGADFIKTSTGKASVAATPEAAVVMCEAIRLFAAQTGRKVGFKAAGGISTRKTLRFTTRSYRKSWARSGLRRNVSGSAPARWRTTCSRPSRAIPYTIFNTGRPFFRRRFYG